MVTARDVFGLPVAPELAALADDGDLDAGVVRARRRSSCEVVVIAPQGNVDVVGVVTTLEGAPLDKGDIASRLGGFDDIVALEADPRTRPTPS